MKVYGQIQDDIFKQNVKLLLDTANNQGGYITNVQLNKVVRRASQFNSQRELLFRILEDNNISIRREKKIEEPTKKLIKRKTK